MTSEPDDPDALWKPGYTGGFRAPDLAGHAPEHGHRRRRWWRSSRVVVAAAIGALAAVAIVLSTPFSDDPEALPPMPWTTTLDTVTVGAIDDRADRLAVLVDRPGVVVVLDLADGAERWRRSAPGDSATGLDIVSAGSDDAGTAEGVVVVRHVDADGAGAALALDVETGAIRWRWALAVGERVEVVGDELRRTSVRDSPNGPAGTARIDPLTGELTEPIEVADDDPPATDNLIRRFGTVGDLLVEAVEVERGLVEITIDLEVAATTFRFAAVDTDDLIGG
ncbi:MAG: hypothetical protein EA389_12170 [Ilumatobacter sp.]|nr:MAG: hypothetical protein EA389_12170 [Ilumatobacter sp.]